MRLIMDFAGRGREELEAVDARLGVDPAAEATRWPAV